MHTAVAIPVTPHPALRSGARMRAAGARCAYGKDEEIFAEGDPADRFYKVISGGVRTCKLLSDGRRQICDFHLAGDVFGVETGATRRLGAEALQDAVLISHRRDDLGPKTLDEAQIIESMALSLERTQRHNLLLGRKSAQEKVASFLIDMSTRMERSDVIELPMSRMDIADYLGLTIETVSRSLTQFERQGVIDVPESRRSIGLRDRAALRRLSSI